MEDYIGNYFKKLHKYKRNKHEYVSLREKEATLISSVCDLLEKSSDYEHEHLSSLAEGSSTELNGKRDEILNFYSETSTKLAILDSTLKTQYHELMSEASDIHKYGCFENDDVFARYLSKLISIVEAVGYMPMDCFYVGSDNQTYFTHYIIKAEPDLCNDKGEFSSYDELITYCRENQAVLLGQCLHKKCFVFQYDENARFLSQSMFVPEKLSYITDAVNSLINLKIQREDEQCTNETKDAFENEFFSSMMERMEVNYKAVSDEYDKKLCSLKDEYDDKVAIVKSNKTSKNARLKQLQKKYKPTIKMPTTKPEE